MNWINIEKKEILITKNNIIVAKISPAKKAPLYGKIGLGNILIGATALYLNASLLTHNKRHFRLIPDLEFAE